MEVLLYYSTIIPLPPQPNISSYTANKNNICVKEKVQLVALDRGSTKADIKRLLKASFFLFFIALLVDCEVLRRRLLLLLLLLLHHHHHHPSNPIPPLALHVPLESSSFSCPKGIRNLMGKEVQVGRKKKSKRRTKRGKKIICERGSFHYLKGAGETRKDDHLMYGDEGGREEGKGGGQEWSLLRRYCASS